VQLVILDPVLAAVPPLVSNEIEAEAIIDKILDWSGALLRRSCLTFVMIEDAIECISAANYYPSRPNIEAMLDMFGLTHVYSPLDIEKSISTILQRTLSLENKTGITVECRMVEVAPSVTAHYTESYFREAIERSLATAVCMQLRLEKGNLLPPVIMAVPHENSVLDVKVSLKSIQMLTQVENLVCPFSLRAQISSPSSFVGMISSLQAAAAWMAAMEAPDIHLAIAIEAFQLLSGGNPKALPQNVPLFHIGGYFCKSLVKNSAWKSGPFGNVVRTVCAKLILGMFGPVPRPFRVSAASAIQKTREDGATGWRVHLTEHGVGLRLMYWSNRDGTLEFSNIGPKGEEFIYDMVEGCAASGGL